MVTLFDEILAVDKAIPADSMGTSPIEKCYIMALLIERLKLHTYVEIGVSRGRTLLSAGMALRKIGGKAIGIDLFDEDSTQGNATGQEAGEDAEKECRQESFAVMLDKRRRLNLESSVTVLPMHSRQAYPYILDRCGEIDMLHMDAGEDAERVQREAHQYIPLVKQGGIVVFDNVHKPEIQKIYEKYSKHMEVLYFNGLYAALYKRERGAVLVDDVQPDGMAAAERPLMSEFEIDHQKRFLKAVADRTQRICTERRQGCKPSVFVGILTYKQEKYIEECLRSVIEQHGDYSIKIVVIDDMSPDGTFDLVKRLETEHPELVEAIEHPSNRGYIEGHIHLHKLFKASGCDYYACVEGDDFLISPGRISAHVDFMEKHPECSVVFNDLVLLKEPGRHYEIHPLHLRIQEEIISIEKLAGEPLIGTWSAATYARDAIEGISEEFMRNVRSSDWLSSVLALENGDLGHIRQPLSIYRIHEQGVWSSMKELERTRNLRKVIGSFNAYTEYRYHPYNRNIVNEEAYLNLTGQQPVRQDLLIVDDFFPCKVSEFRYEEFTRLLRHFKKSRLLTTGRTLQAVDKRLDLQDELRAFKEENVDIAAQVDDYYAYYDEGKTDYRAAYFCFLSNAYSMLHFVEEKNIPFAFELYPGGQMAVGNASVDAMLRRVFASPCFRKVLVTQDLTERYLIQRGLCKRENIVKTFGVVMLQDNLDCAVDGIEQTQKPLQICFAAHRYSQYGEDKGYDVFIETAKILHRKNPEYRFHVAGNFDEQIIDVSELGDSISFHGLLSPQELREFLNSMDILISANRPGRIYRGSYDGFPTTCATVAMLQGTLVLLTDPLKLNGDRYIDGEEIVIVPPLAEAIAEKAEYFNGHREEMARICRKQLEKTRKLYDIKAQISPRIEMLKAIIEE